MVTTTETPANADALAPAPNKRKPRKPKEKPAPGDKSQKKRGRYSISIAGGAGIEQIAISDLKPWPKNARVHTKSQVDEIARSIRANGFRDPIEVDEANVILSGHGKVMAAKQVGMDTVPCVRHLDMTYTQKRRYVLVANQTALNSEWDRGLLVGELRAMRLDDEPIRDLGFEDDVLKDALADDLDLPDLGDSDPELDTPDVSTEEGTAAPEEVEAIAGNDLTGADLEPTPDAEKPRYHQLPPEDASRAIRASEERIPLGFLMNRAEFEYMEEYKKKIGAKTDKAAIRFAIGMDTVVGGYMDNVSSVTAKVGDGDGSAGSEGPAGEIAVDDHGGHAGV